MYSESVEVNNTFTFHWQEKATRTMHSTTKNTIPVVTNRNRRGTYTGPSRVPLLLTQPSALPRPWTPILRANHQ